MELLEVRITPAYQFSTLASFLDPNGATPYGGIVMDSSGNLFGTTSQDGTYGDGTVFEFAPSTGTLTPLAAFNGTNGAQSLGALVVDSGGNLYGTASTGGAYGDGTVFKLAHGSSTITVLASFNGINGAAPQSGLVMDNSGNLYGTCNAGGSSQHGTVFEVAAGSGTITTLASFDGTNELKPDYAGLVRDAAGNWYGTTEQGGASNQGAVYELAAGSGILTVLASFNGTNGATPDGTLILDGSGNLYGTTEGGGAAGDGTVFELPHGSGTITTLASFGGTNGLQPEGSLLRDGKGNLYGTTVLGGSSSSGAVFELAQGSSTITLLASGNSSYGTAFYGNLAMDGSGNLYGTASSGGTGGNNNGTLFELPPGSSYILPLTSFDFTNGASPTGALLRDSSGNLYGTTQEGGTSNDGTVFKLAAGSGTITPLASFTFWTSGANPYYAGLVMDSSGNLYGTANNGGTYNDGTVFELAAGSSTITALATFNGNNGAHPWAGLIRDRSGNLYGTTTQGGSWNDGTIFEVPAGSNGIVTLASFNGTNGSWPQGSLAMDSNGNLYGTAYFGGLYSNGVVFELPAGSFSINPLASFTGTNGTGPLGGVILDGSGNLYGTTQGGGASREGTVFELPHGSGTITTVASFSGTNTAQRPQVGVVMDSSGNLYGTTNGGGTSGDGTIYEVAAGSGTVTTMFSFNGTNGSSPEGALIIDSAGNLYGTTNWKSTDTYGTVFELAAISHTVDLGVAADGYAKDPDSDGTFESVNTTDTLDHVSYLPGTSVGEERGIVEFSVSGVDPTATIVSATLEGNVSVLQWNSQETGVTVGVYGYAGDGQVTTSGATASTKQVGTLTTTSLGHFSITISPSFVQSLLGNSSTYAGFMLRLLQGEQFYFDSSRNTTTSLKPTLHLVLDHPPQAVNDSYSAISGTPLTVAAPGVLANDTDLDSDPLTAMLVSGPAHGTLTLNANGSFTYTPNAGFAGSDGFTYQANDGYLNSNTATVTLTVNLAPASRFVVSGFPSPATAGVAGTFTVTAEDNNGNVVTGYTGTVHFTSGYAQAVLPADYTFTAADAGVHTFTATLKTAGSQSLVATDTATSSITGSQTVTVNAALAAHLAVSAPATWTPGVSCNVTVTLTDTYGNVATGYSGTVRFTSSDPQATLPADYTFTAADAGTHNFAVTLQTLGTQTLTVADTVNAGLQASATVTVQVHDLLITATNRVYQFSPTGTQENILFVPNTPISSDTQIARGLTVDANQNIQVVTGTSNNYLAAYTPSTNSWSQHTIPGWSTLPDLTAGGVASFQQYVFVTDEKSGSETSQEQGLIRFDTTDYSYQRFATGTDFNQVTIGLNGLLYALEPSDGQVAIDIFNPVTLALLRRIIPATPPNGSITPDPRAIAVDARGQMFVADWSGRILDYDPSGTFVKALTYTNNVADLTLFADGRLVAVTWNGTVITTDESLASYTTFTLPSSGTLSYFVTAYLHQPVTLGTANLVVSASPTTLTAGNTETVTVTAEDDFGNPVPNYTGTVHFTSADAQATLPADYTFTAADEGVHTFTVVLRTAGSQTILATDTFAITPIPGSATVAVQPASASSLLVAGFPSPTTAGVTHTFTVTAVDAYHNVATAYRGTVHFTNGDPRVTLPANYTFTATDAGVHTFTATLRTAGTQSINAADTVTAAINGAQTGIVVVPNVVTHFNVALFPSPEQAGVTGAFRVIARDAYNNTVTSYHGTVHFTTSDPGKGVRLPANYTFTSTDKGIHTFHATLFTAGTQSLTAIDTVTSSISGSQTGILITPAALNHFRVNGFTNPTVAGAAHTVSVQAKDAYGNTVTSYTGTLAFSSSDPQAVLPGPYTFTTADAGTHTFAATLKTAGTQSITVTDQTTPTFTGTQASIKVNPAAATKFVLSGLPASGTAGTAQTFTVTAEDTYGNTATGYTGMVHFTSNDMAASLPTDYTFTSTDAGVHTFSVTFNTLGPETITATDTVSAALTGSASMTVQPAGLAAPLASQRLLPTTGSSRSQSTLSAGVLGSWAIRHRRATDRLFAEPEELLGHA